jgi:hypothetical protein
MCCLDACTVRHSDENAVGGWFDVGAGAGAGEEVRSAAGVCDCGVGTCVFGGWGESYRIKTRCGGKCANVIDLSVASGGKGFG